MFRATDKKHKLVGNLVSYYLRDRKGVCAVDDHKNWLGRDPNTYWSSAVGRFCTKAQGTIRGVRRRLRQVAAILQFAAVVSDYKQGVGCFDQKTRGVDTKKRAPLWLFTYL